MRAVHCTESAGTGLAAPVRFAALTAPYDLAKVPTAIYELHLRREELKAIIAASEHA